MSAEMREEITGSAMPPADRIECTPRNLMVKGMGEMEENPFTKRD